MFHLLIDKKTFNQPYPLSPDMCVKYGNISSVWHTAKHCLVIIPFQYMGGLTSKIEAKIETTLRDKALSWATKTSYF